ncbi:phosphatidylglycerophosphatase A [Pacificibacter sp. AS14]|uniref:phosphatidylglycerophosphatase A family protein n=1 Tax=Pacificibacter sp. AS14 TaxID=3135785 RepID=UPI003182575E
MKDIAEIIATFARVGYLKPAPGTWGSAAAIPVFWAINEAGGFGLIVFATIVVFIVGLWATQVMTKDATEGTEEHDPSEIVIDEVAGQWIALWPVAFGAQMMGVESARLWPGYLAAFLLFRLFDIWKPSLVGKADRRGDAMGVMLDDVIAGVFAAICVVILASLAHGFLM